jgi:hypothetical protein
MSRFRILLAAACLLGALLPTSAVAAKATVGPMRLGFCGGDEILGKAAQTASEQRIGTLGG